jgi:chromosome segregation protein
VKRTMQLVDFLYGVTMPEAGVSKIVSVKINDTQSQRSGQPARPGGPGEAQVSAAVA